MMEIPSWLAAVLASVLPMLIIIGLGLLQYWMERLTYTRDERSGHRGKPQFPEETYLDTTDRRVDWTILCVVCIAILFVVWVLYANGSLQ